jgi:hypothetical protein
LVGSDLLSGTTKEIDFDDEGSRAVLSESIAGGYNMLNLCVSMLYYWYRFSLFSIDERLHAA